MRFFHLSDLHIGLKLLGRDLMEDQEYIFDKVISYADEYKPDAVVIAGDIYDRAVPSAEAVEMFDHFITELSGTVPEAHIMIISGNHDNPLRLDLFRNLLSARSIHMTGTPPRTPSEYIEKVVLTDEYGEVNFYLLPFVKPSMVKAITGTDENGNNLSYNETLKKLIERENIDPGARNVLVSHQFYIPKDKTADSIERMDSEIRTVGNIDEVSADILKNFDYAALGHIHKPMKAGNEFFRYCGTPLAVSVSEAGQNKGIICVEMSEKGSLSTEILPLEPLRQVRLIKGTLDEVLKQACDDYVSVLLTDKADLDVADMQDRLRMAFPYLLEIRRQTYFSLSQDNNINVEEIPDTYGLCEAFLKSTEDDEKDLLRDIVNTVLER